MSYNKKNCLGDTVFTVRNEKELEKKDLKKL